MMNSLRELFCCYHYVDFYMKILFVPYGNSERMTSSSSIFDIRIIFNIENCTIHTGIEIKWN